MNLIFNIFIRIFAGIGIGIVGTMLFNIYLDKDDALSQYPAVGGKKNE